MTHVPETLVHVHDTATSLSKVEARNTRKYVLPMVFKWVWNLGEDRQHGNGVKE